MDNVGPQEIRRIREAFFSRTRRLTIVLYVVLGLVAVGTATIAVADDPVHGLTGVVAGFAVTTALFVVSAMIPTSARTARLLIYASPILILVGNVWIEVPALGLSTAFVLGIFAGICGGMCAGIAAIRRRLAHDDKLLLRQKGLGFDPERPYGWLRRSR